MENARSRLCLFAVSAGLALPGVAAPLAHWPLDEGSGQAANDGSGHGHHGRLGALAEPDHHDPTWVSGRLGTALRFDGAQQQYVAVAAAGGLQPQRVSVEGWVRRLGSPGQWRYVLAGGAKGCNSASYGLYSSFNGGLAFYVTGTASYVLSPEVAPEQVWDGAWHYAVGSYDGQRVRLYLDGREIGAGTAGKPTISYGSGSMTMHIGSYRGSCELPFTGDIDEVAIHGRALGAQEVAQAAAQASQLAPPAQQPPVSGPPPSRRTSCLKIEVTPKRVLAHKRSVLRVTVRRSKRRLAGVRVSVRGVSTAKRVRTGRRGRARLAVRPRRTGRLKVKAVGQPRRCAGGIVKVARRR